MMATRKAFSVFKKSRNLSKAFLLGNQMGYITVRERENKRMDVEQWELGKL